MHAVALVGLRFGATLAAVAAAQRRDVQSLVLWAPCASGRAYLRELRAFQMLEEHDGRGTPGAPQEGDEAALAIDLFARRERIAERALIIPRDDLPAGAERLASHLAAAESRRASTQRRGTLPMMRDPQDGEVPVAALDTIVAWLREPQGPCARGAERAGASSLVLVALSHAERLPVREESLYFGEVGRLLPASPLSLAQAPCAAPHRPSSSSTWAPITASGPIECTSRWRARSGAGLPRLPLRSRRAWRQPCCERRIPGESPLPAGFGLAT